MVGPSIDTEVFEAVVEGLACPMPGLRRGDKPHSAFKLARGATVGMPSGITVGTTVAILSGTNAGDFASPSRMGTLAKFAKAVNLPV
jgi:hypothetical protein